MAKGKYQSWQTPEGLGLLEAWARDGLTDEQLAQQMGINPATLYRWMKEHCKICKAITRGRGGAREQIENALFKKATGGVEVFPKTIKRRIREYNKTGKCIRDEEVVEEIEVKKRVEPDMEAIKFYLTNRAKDRWALMPEPDVTADERENVTVIVDV